MESWTLDRTVLCDWVNMSKLPLWNLMSLICKQEWYLLFKMFWFSESMCKMPGKEQILSKCFFFTFMLCLDLISLYENLQTLRWDSFLKMIPSFMPICKYGHLCPSFMNICKYATWVIVLCWFWLPAPVVLTPNSPRFTFGGAPPDKWPPPLRKCLHHQPLFVSLLKRSSVFPHPCSCQFSAAEIHDQMCCGWTVRGTCQRIVILMWPLQSDLPPKARRASVCGYTVVSDSLWSHEL